MEYRGITHDNGDQEFLIQCNNLDETIKVIDFLKENNAKHK